MLLGIVVAGHPQAYRWKPRDLVIPPHFLME